MKNRHYRIDFYASLFYFIASILFLVIDDGFLRYGLNFLLLLMTFVLLLSSPLRNKAINWVFLTIFYLSYIFLSILVVGNELNITSFVSFYSFFMLAYIFVYSDNGKRYLDLFYLLYFFLVIIIFFLLLTGVEAEDIFSGSRNAVSLLLVPLGCMFLLDKRVIMNKKLAFLLYFLVFLSCVMAQGRSGILTSLLLLIGSSLTFFKNTNYKKALLITLISITILILINKYFEYIYSLSYFDYLRSAGIEDSYRTNMRNEYISSLRSVNIFFGKNLFELPMIRSFNGNPHNTYIYLHSSLGIIFILTTSFAILYWLKMFITKDFISFFVLLALLLRLSTDSTSSIAILPLIFVSLSFFRKLEFFRKQFI